MFLDHKNQRIICLLDTGKKNAAGLRLFLLHFARKRGARQGHLLRSRRQRIPPDSARTFSLGLSSISCYLERNNRRVRLVSKRTPHVPCPTAAGWESGHPLHDAASVHPGPDARQGRRQTPATGSAVAALFCRYSFYDAHAATEPPKDSCSEQGPAR